MIDKLVEPCERKAPDYVKKGYVHPVLNRINHWAHAFLIVLLLWSGFQIAFPNAKIFFGVGEAVVTHKVCGVLLLIQMPLWFIYRAVSGRMFWRCLPCPCDFFLCSWRQIKYYLFDIFVGRPHPYDPRELNPMQRITYVSLMLIVLPIAMLSGAVLMWPHAFAWLLARVPIKTVTLVHLIAAFIFLFFIGLHIYLATTGAKPWSYFKAMITGWVDKEELEEYLKHAQTSKEA